MNNTDKNLEQLWEDIKGLRDNYCNKEGIILLYRYLLSNLELINASYLSFNDKVTEEALSSLAKAPSNSVSGRFYSKSMVDTFFENYLTELGSKIEWTEYGLYHQDSFYDKMDMTSATIAALMYFSETSQLNVNRNILLQNLPRKFSKYADFNNITANTFTVTIMGGMIEHENEEEFRKINFSFGNNNFQFATEASVSIPGFKNEICAEFFAKEFRKVIYFPSEIKHKIITELVKNNFKIIEKVVN